MSIKHCLVHSQAKKRQHIYIDFVFTKYINIPSISVRSFYTFLNSSEAFFHHKLIVTHFIVFFGVWKWTPEHYLISCKQQTNNNIIRLISNAYLSWDCTKSKGNLMVYSEGNNLKEIFTALGLEDFKIVQNYKFHVMPGSWPWIWTSHNLAQKSGSLLHPSRLQRVHAQHLKREYYYNSKRTTRRQFWIHDSVKNIVKK